MMDWTRFSNPMNPTIIVRYRWDTDLDAPMKIESFETKRQATSWMKTVCKQRPGEAQIAIFDAVGVAIPASCKPQVVLAWTEEDASAPRAVMWLKRGSTAAVEKAQSYADQKATEPGVLRARVFVYSTSERDPLTRAKQEIMG